MGKIAKLDISHFFLAGLVTVLMGLPLTISLILGDFGYLHSVIAGLFAGLYGGLVVLSEDYPFLRIICALICMIIAIVLCNYSQISMPATVFAAFFGAIVGYFSRKWIEILWHINP